MKLFLFPLAALCALAAVDGTVTNLTSGKPQTGATVTLVELGGGMESAGSVKTDAAGKFAFPVTLKKDIPYLLQALHQGVTYNQMLQAGAAGTGLNVDVYDAAAKAPEAKVAQHMILLEPTEKEVVVNESVIFNNTGKTTFFDPEGTLKVWVPSNVSSPVRIRITAPQGMPISREAEKGKQANVYLVRYPVKPGETRVDLQYSLPPATEFKSKVLHDGGPVRLVAPKGVKFVGSALTDLGPEPRTGATVYELKGTEYAMNIEGTGALREGGSGGGGEQRAEATPAPDDTPGIEMVKPRLYQRLGWVIGLTLTMLLLGLVMLYRNA